MDARRRGRRRIVLVWPVALFIEALRRLPCLDLGNAVTVDRLRN